MKKIGKFPSDDSAYFYVISSILIVTNTFGFLFDLDGASYVRNFRYYPR
jgi:hypothetical protein